jgi:CDP-diacylglycerol--glycerol-3-phosphate 3-phosphatidyltransferase
MNTPNKLTLLRLILAPIGVTILFLNIPYNFLISTVIFLLAMATDVADGIIARKFDMITKLGKFLDPLADKLTLLLYFIFLQNAGIYPLWLLLIFIGREIIVDNLRSFAVSQNLYMGAIKSGKIKALCQTVSIVIGLIFISIQNNQFFGVTGEVEILKTMAYYIMLAGLIVGISGGIFLIKNNKSILNDKF